MPSNYVPGSVWYYQPNKVAPRVFASLYFSSGLQHAYQTWKYKSWKMTLFIPWGCALMVGGFITRAVAAYHIHNIPLLIATYALLLSGPPVYAGADYFILGRLLYYIPWLSPVHPGRVVITFIGIDALVEILVTNGITKLVDTRWKPSVRRAGADMVKAGLLLQAASFIFYLFLLVVWHVRVKRHKLLTKRLAAMVWTLYVSASLIFVRCVYRAIEFFQGYTGTIFTHESYFYVFEAGLMLVNSFLLTASHPGRYFPENASIYLARDGKTHVLGPGWRDPRKWYWQLFDPFDIRGFFVKTKNDFWNDPIPAGANADVNEIDLDASNNESVGQEPLPKYVAGEEAPVYGSDEADGSVQRAGHEAEQVFRSA